MATQSNHDVEPVRAVSMQQSTPSRSPVRIKQAFESSLEEWKHGATTMLARIAALQGQSMGHAQTPVQLQRHIG
ncbi:MAG: hypothetical protein EPN64_05760 [Burkholderiaceae bacterium]|nr:MAG: hypothetical protein EPN64_05760 [Burkholderiaceae bacterium]